MHKERVCGALIKFSERRKKGKERRKWAGEGGEGMGGGKRKKKGDRKRWKASRIKFCERTTKEVNDEEGLNDFLDLLSSERRKYCDSSFSLDQSEIPITTGRLNRNRWNNKCRLGNSGSENFDWIGKIIWKRRWQLLQFYFILFYLFVYLFIF